MVFIVLAIDKLTAEFAEEVLKVAEKIFSDFQYERLLISGYISVSSFCSVDIIEQQVKNN